MSTENTNTIDLADEPNRRRTPKFDVTVQLSGEDGNAFAVLGRVSKALRKAGATSTQLAEFTIAATDGDYDHLLGVVQQWVHAR